MKWNLRRNIKNFVGGNSGSYITEGALSLPVLIICVCSLVIIIRITAICENITFLLAGEMNRVGLEAYKKINYVSSCKSVERAILKGETALSDIDVTEWRYFFGKENISTL